MRLINTRNLSLEDFSLRTIPPYAILSHTWADEEITFQDMSLPSRFSKKGFKKIQSTCELALQQGLEYAWVDTCCIDKSSSAELTESINSMFRWYRDAFVCFVFLDDLPPEAEGQQEEMGVLMGRCRWFTRGWTLQELLAPRVLAVYDTTWTPRGVRSLFVDIICHITGIPKGVVRGTDDLETCSLAMKMSWAARRQTTRIEDMAYCLLGLFDVNMPLIYGEGPKAFRRLQEEIVRRMSDLTIFAWSPLQADQTSEFLGLFASSPAEFVNATDIQPFSDDFQNFSVTNKGLLMSGDAPLRVVRLTMEGGYEVLRYLMFSGRPRGKNRDRTRNFGILMRKLGPKIFCRDGMFPLAELGAYKVNQVAVLDVNDYYILIDPISRDRYHKSTTAFREYALHVPLDDQFVLMDAVPEALWDVSDRIFLRPKPYKWTRYPMILAMRFRGTLAGKSLSLLVLCDYRLDSPTFKVFIEEEFHRQVAKLFDGKNREESFYWTDLEVDGQDILHLKHYVNVDVRNVRFRVAVSCKERLLEGVSSEAKVFSLKFEVSRLG